MKPATIISPSNLEEQLNTRNSISPSKLEGDGGSVTDKNADYHTPQSLRDSSSNLEEQLNTRNSSSPSKLEGAGGSVTASQNESMTASPNHHKRIKNIPKVKIIRRELRNHSTKAEKSLWNWLKQDQIKGFRFRRQFSIDNFILDFYCPRLKLCIELDGDYHYHVLQPLKDAERDKLLFDKHGIHTLRFENYIVFEQPHTIINAILNFIENANTAPCDHDGDVRRNLHTPPKSPSKLEEQLSTRNSNSPSKLEGAGGSVTASQLRIVIVGSGNVATCFALALKDKCTIVQVYSRNPAHAQALAERVGCPWTSSTDQLAPDGEVYIVAVNDDAIAALGQAVLDNGAVWVHTSGSTSIDALSATRCRCGVMWPMQSLSKSHAAALGQVHLFIEGSDSEVLMQLRELALLITPNVHEVSGADRLKLHVASVFASNFSNHMYSLAAEVLAEAGIPFEALLPLIKSTVAKLDAMSPAQSQTGPAARGDEGVMAKHLAMLTGDKQEIYRMLSRSIAKRRSE